MIRVSTDFSQVIKGLKGITHYIENIPFVRVEAEAETIAEETVHKMVQVIEDNRKNPARPGISKLQTALGPPEEILNDPGKELIVGIGNIEKLKQDAKYWELIDAGGTYVTKETHVVPTTYFSGPESDFLTFKKGSSHTIEGIDYIGIALRELPKKVEKMIRDLGGQFVGDIQKASK